MVKIGKYDYQLSKRKNKKLFTVVDEKEVHFGDIRYSHFFDRSLLLPKKLNHNDEKRRKNYLTRSANQKAKGKLTRDNPKSPNYHARRVLW